VDDRNRLTSSIRSDHNRSVFLQHSTSPAARINAPTALPSLCARWRQRNISKATAFFNAEHEPRLPVPTYTFKQTAEPFKAVRPVCPTRNDWPSPTPAAQQPTWNLRHSTSSRSATLHVKSGNGLSIRAPVAFTINQYGSTQLAARQRSKTRLEQQWARHDSISGESLAVQHGLAYVLGLIPSHCNSYGSATLQILGGSPGIITSQELPHASMPLSARRTCTSTGIPPSLVMYPSTWTSPWAATPQSRGQTPAQRPALIIMTWTGAPADAGTSPVDTSRWSFH